MQTLAATKMESPYLGTWRNTNNRATDFTSLEFTTKERGLILCVRGRTTEEFAAPVEIFVGNDGATAPMKIMAHRDLGFMDILLHGWVKQGVLVLAIFRRFNDATGRSDYFDREFFYRADGPC
jgi:hypothetical protein